MQRMTRVETLAGNINMFSFERRNDSNGNLNLERTVTCSMDSIHWTTAHREFHFRSVFQEISRTNLCKSIQSQVSCRNSRYLRKKPSILGFGGSSEGGSEAIMGASRGLGSNPWLEGCFDANFMQINAPPCQAFHFTSDQSFKVSNKSLI